MIFEVIDITLPLRSPHFVYVKIMNTFAISGKVICSSLEGQRKWLKIFQEKQLFQTSQSDSVIRVHSQ